MIDPSSSLGSMFDLLQKHIGARINLKQSELDRCVRFFALKKIRKHEFILQEGEICRYLAFVNRGCLREYTVDQKGEEHIIQFAIEDWWISDLNSFLSGKASTHNIDALQDSEILLLERSARDALLDQMPGMERFFRLLLEKNYVATHQRINEALGSSAEERYLKFIKTYPTVVEMVPQNQVASYLGITPQSLSRIRKELSQRR